MSSLVGFVVVDRVVVRSARRERQPQSPTSSSSGQACWGYPIKSKLQYGVNIYADDPYKDNKTCYGEAYGPDDMAYLCKVVDDGGNLELMKFDLGSRGGG